ncbi:hypothetical protein AVEN_213818-1 [Araneus ventricosus]|uniref:Uncharacterized protein n=1 Tax=Araneus ventricosus TaxID=182803 RepID=A0A4Y2X5Q7_ARAVE|nr:hypothetical protein AVEN_166414-1 [Araneus ventricosus]GBO43457.1 hypothetical protein AVEN_213818-1 [Araneus ventricosus]
MWSWWTLNMKSRVKPPCNGVAQKFGNRMVREQLVYKYTERFMIRREHLMNRSPTTGLQVHGMLPPQTPGAYNLKGYLTSWMDAR